VRHAPAAAVGLLLVVVQLEIALVGARDVDDERQRLAQERLELVLRAEVEQAPVEVGLALRPRERIAQRLGVVARRQITRSRASAWRSAADRPSSSP
jgi:hypothetical protein